MVTEDNKIGVYLRLSPETVKDLKILSAKKKLPMYEIVEDLIKKKVLEDE